MTDYVIPPAPQAAVKVAGTDKMFPVRRIWCVGRNYLEHIKEMGQDEREPPFFFAKPADAIVPDGGTHKFTFELKLFKARRRAEKVLEAEGDKDFYVTHLSCRVIVYKGLVMPAYLPVLYSDLNDPALDSSIVVFHQRFSTNTLPQWRLAHPFRFLAHNGEINTIAGNRMWAQARR